MFHAFGEQGVEFGDFDAMEGETVEIIKYVSMYTERDAARYALHGSVKDEIDGFLEIGFEEELAAHRAVYEEMWKAADIRIEGDFELDRAVRFNIFHLMSTGNERDARVNVGAKLLSGEEYGGHAFWDTEIFMLPFFLHTFSLKRQEIWNLTGIICWMQQGKMPGKTAIKEHNIHGNLRMTAQSSALTGPLSRMVPVTAVM